MGIQGSTFILIILFTVCGWTKTQVLPYPEKAGYLEASTNQPPSLQAIDKFFKLNQYIAIKGQGHPTAQNLQWLDRIYMTQKSGQSVLVKSRIKIKGPMELGKIYQHPKGLLIHLPENKNTVTAFFFTGFSPDAVESLASQLKRRLGDKTTAFNERSLIDFFVPRAHAVSLSDPGFPCAQGDPVSAPNAEPDLMQTTMACLQGVGAGISNSTVEVIPSIIDGTVAMAQGAWNSTVWWFTTNNQQKWDAMVDQKQKLETIINGFPTMLGHMKTAWDALPSDIKARVICEAVSTLGVPVLFTAITGGASAAAIGVQLGKVVAKLAKQLNSPALDNFAQGLIGFELAEHRRRQIARISHFSGGSRIVDKIKDLDNLKARVHASAQALSIHIARQPKLNNIPAWKAEYVRLTAAHNQLIEDAKQKTTELNRTMDDFWKTHQSELKMEEFKEFMGSSIYSVAWACNLTGDIAEVIRSTAPATQQ